MSGLGDRLTDILMLSAYARMRAAKILIDWPPFEAKSIDIEHRKTDILLENVLNFISFPPEVVFDKSSSANEDFPHYIGGGNNPAHFHQSYIADRGNLAEYLQALTAVSKDFVFCDAIRDFLKTVPKRFVSFHIRRGDKVRNEPSDGNFTNISELDWLTSATYRAFELYIKLSYDTFFICGDEDDKKAPFVEYVQGKDKSVFKIPDMPKWESTYYDMAVMSKSEHNVASQRYSSFSSFPSLLSGGTYMTVFRLNAAGLV